MSAARQLSLVVESIEDYIFHIMDLTDLGKALTYKLELPGGQSRLREAALYIMGAGRDFEYFGLIKLNKMLWRADFRSFHERRFPITGRSYQKLEHGPAPVEMKPVLRELENLGRIKYADSGVPNEKRPVPLVDVKISNLSPRDLEFLDEAISYYRDLTATATSKESHGVAWRSRKMGELIPYETAIFDDRPLSQSLEHKLMWLGRERGWHSH